MDSSYRKIKDLAADVFRNQNKILGRLDEIENLIRNHSIGVQNVYNELSQIKTMYNVVEMDSDLMDKIVKTKEIWE